MACHPGSRAPAAPGLRDKETLRGTCSSREGRAAGWDATRRRVPGFQGRALTQCCPTRGGSRRARGARPGSCQGRGAGPYGAPAACAAPGVGSSEPDAAPVLRLVTRREAHDEPDGGGSGRRPGKREGRGRGGLGRRSRAPLGRGPAPRHVGTPVLLQEARECVRRQHQGLGGWRVASGQAGPRAGGWAQVRGAGTAGRGGALRPLLGVEGTGGPPRPTVEVGDGRSWGVLGRGRWQDRYAREGEREGGLGVALSLGTDGETAPEMGLGARVSGGTRSGSAGLAGRQTPSRCRCQGCGQGEAAHTVWRGAGAGRWHVAGSRGPGRQQGRETEQGAAGASATPAAGQVLRPLSAPRRIPGRADWQAGPGAGDGETRLCGVTRQPPRLTPPRS